MEKDLLTDKRFKLNKIDEEIFALLEKRRTIVKAIGEIKMKNNLPIRDKKREQELIERACAKFEFDKKFIAKFYKIIFKYSYELEK